MTMASTTGRPDIDERISVGKHIAPLALQALDSEDESKSAEIRLGLVLYGGVSLAIYMNGVTYELFRAVHGKGIYRLIKALTDSDIVVDIISGASAGGINGITLAYALASGKDVTPVARMWREDGDIENLFHDPLLPRDRALSIMDSDDVYLPLLEKGFYTVGETPINIEDGDDPSRTTRLDLFITGTDVGGRVESSRDDAGAHISLKDHRAVFRLKYRDYNTRDLDPDFGDESDPDQARQNHHRALAKLANITSCFPGAFAPVHVKATQPGEIDNWIARWGDLKHDAYYIDGGTLNNKPFDHTINAIAEGRSDHDVTRKLFFVDPSPTEYELDEDLVRPGLVGTGISTVSIWSHETISDDLRRISERNEKLERYRRLLRQLRQAAEAYDYAGAQAQFATGADESLQSMHMRSRLLQLAEWGAELILSAQGANKPYRDPADHQRAAEMVRSFYAISSREDQIQLAQRLFNDVDVHYRIRRLRMTLDHINERLYGSPGDTAGVLAGSEVGSPKELVDSYKRLLTALNRQFDRYKILRWAYENLIRTAHVNWQDLEPAPCWRILYRAAYQLFQHTDSNGALEPDDDPQLWRDEMGRRLDQLRDKLALSVDDDAFLEVHRTLLHDLDDFERQVVADIIRDPDDPVRRTYERCIWLDAHLFPLEVVSGLEDAEYIHLFRISPADAQLGFSKRAADDKISGNVLRNFGSFFKRSWRSNDILWGRLDGTSKLVETLLDPDRICQLCSTERLVTIRERLFEHYDQESIEHSRCRASHEPAMLFRNAGSATHRSLKTWLWEVVSPHEHVRDRAVEAARFGEIVELLVEAEQLETIHAELPKVIDDALHTQRNWNQYQVASPVHDGVSDSRAIVPNSGASQQAWHWRRPREWVDSLVATTGSHSLLLERFDDLREKRQEAQRPIETGVGHYFCRSYSVGTETLTRDVPLLILLHYVATALLLLRSCVLNSLPSRAAESVSENRLYKLAVDVPLRGFRGMIMLARTMPVGLIAIFFAMFVVSVLAIIVGTLWWSEIISPDQGFSALWFIVFILTPVCILILQWRLLMWDPFWNGLERSDRLRRDVARLLFVSPLALSMFLLVLGVLRSDRMINAPAEWRVDLRWFAGLILVPVAALIITYRLPYWSSIRNLAVFLAPVVVLIITAVLWWIFRNQLRAIPDGWTLAYGQLAAFVLFPLLVLRYVYWPLLRSRIVSARESHSRSSRPSRA